MTRRTLAVLFSSLVIASLAGAGPASASQAKAADFSGIVALSNCSGSVVKFADSVQGDPALVLSNGHCLEGGFPAQGEVITNKPSKRTFKLLSGDGNSELGTLAATKIVYATMTGTDTALYQLNASYSDLLQGYGTEGRTLGRAHPGAGTNIDIVSGYSRKAYSCTVDGFVPELREGDWSWRDSIRYTPDCMTVGGTSGSPILDSATGDVLGVNNTGNEGGAECAMNNPCEVDEDGNITTRPDGKYGQETYLFYGCLGAGSQLDLNQPECRLPKPAKLDATLPKAA